MTRFFFSLRFRLLLLVLLAVIPALGLILYTAAEQRRVAVVDAQQNALRLARLAASDQERLVEGARQLLIALAQLPSVRNRDEAECTLFLTDLLKQYPLYANLGVVEPDGDVSCSAVPLAEPVSTANRTWFQRAVQTRNFAVSEYQIGRITGKALITFAYPIIDETGRVDGVVFVGLDLAWLNQFVAKAQLPSGATLRVIDQNGTILARYPDPEKWVGRSMPEATIVKTILSQGEGVADALGEDGVPRLYAFTPLRTMPGADLYVSIGVPKEVAFAEADRILARNLVSLGLVAVLALAAAWVGGDLFILHQVNALLGVTKRLAAGDLGARTGLRYGAGELSQLARTFDQMAETVEQRETERERAEKQIRRQTARAESLARVASRLNAQLDLEGVLKAICEEIARALNVPATSVSLCDEKRDALYHVSGFGLPPEYCQHTQPIPRAIYNEYAKQMDSLIIFQDVQDIPHLPDANLYAALNIRTIVVAGMLRQQQLVGCLNIITFSQVRHFTEDELALLKGLANQAAQAIINARLYEALQREERARAGLLHKIITAQEYERKRIARELHDETSQSLTALMLGLDTVRMALAVDARKAEEHLQTIKYIAEGMLGNIHRLIADLRPSLLDDLGLVPAITWYGEQRLNPLGITLYLDEDGLQGRLSPAMETALFRIVQEAMTNVVRHARASAVTVRLVRRGGYLTLQIADNGCGFDPQILQSADPRSEGLGLRGIQERVNILGGEFYLQPAPGQGTVITVHVPIPEEEVAHV
jgi:signal transduction histidine kinase